MARQRYSTQGKHLVNPLPGLLMVCFFVLLLPGYTHSEAPVDDHAFESVRSSPKIVDPDSVLRGFAEGGAEVHVIVDLQRPKGARDIGSLQELSSRQRLRNIMRAVQEETSQGLDNQDVRITNRFSYMPGFSASVTLRGLCDLIAAVTVTSIEPDLILRAHLAQGIPLINASTVRSTYDGQGLAIAICDTGIDYNHPRLGNGGFPNSKVIGGYDFGGSVEDPDDEDDDPLDEQGHGTSCAGIAAGDLPGQGDYSGGVAHGSRLYAIKISYGSSGGAFTSDMIAGWEWCISHQYDNPAYPIMVISTSFGGGGYASVCDDLSTAMTQAAENAVSAGMTLFVSSGNNGFCDSISWPDCISHVISVGAVFDADIGAVGFCVDPSSCAPNQQYHAGCFPYGLVAAFVDTTQGGQVTQYSNVASFLDVLAPAHNTYTTDLGGAYVADFGGTSAACPYAAGVAASLQSAAKENTGAFLSPDQIRSKLIASGNPIAYEPSGVTKPGINLGAVDIDDDGMAAEWEIVHFGDLTHDGTGDTDEDGLTDIQEYKYDTDPNEPDTDGDQMTDGWEVTYNLDPKANDADVDTDQDGWTNLEEYQSETDPRDPDSHPLAVPASSTSSVWLMVVCLLILGMTVKRKTISTHAPPKRSV